ncbi:putative Histidine kinase [Sesbania bispinosa]|nr:putative Histidine kinase [Sesbania bispinosa]
MAASIARATLPPHPASAAAPLCPCLWRGFAVPLSSPPRNATRHHCSTPLLEPPLTAAAPPDCTIASSRAPLHKRMGQQNYFSDSIHTSPRVSMGKLKGGSHQGRERRPWSL